MAPASNDVPVVVRPATRADMPAMSGLGATAFRDAYTGTAPVEDIGAHVLAYFSEAAMAEEMQRDNIWYFLAELQGILAGIVKLRCAEVPEPLPSKRVIEVQQLYVATNLQRGGIGHHLIEQAIAFARERGQEGIWLNVWENAPWAVSFYQKLGFVQHGTLVFRLGDTKHRDLVMYLPV